LNGIELAERFEQTVMRWETSTGQTRVAHAVNLKTFIELAAYEIGAVERWLLKHDEWFDANENHPKFEERVDSWIARMCVYERLYDLIARAQVAIKETSYAA
jgi:hypothetical protein